MIFVKIKDFALEIWLNPRVDWPACRYNFGSSCVKPFTIEELLDLCGQDAEEFFEEFRKMSLHYGYFFGFDRLLSAIAKMYSSVSKDMILTVHGGTGANNIVITELVEKCDNVVSVIPNYQQHYSIPESLGAEVRYLTLNEEDGYLPDTERLAQLIDENTRLLTLSNPNNPTGAYIREPLLKEICALADKFGTYILCDEIYRGLDDKYMPSIVDLCERGIATSSTSKVFSMAGTRVGWIVTGDRDIFMRLQNRRSYDTICDGVLDEWITAIAFEHCGKILERSRKIVQTSRAVFDEWIPSQPRLSSKIKSFGTTAFVKYDYDIDSPELCDDIVEKSGVLLCQGDCFEIPRTFRLGYGFGNPDLFREGLEKLGDYFKEYRQ
jgi:aspartate/methionine/tyrosine aminotransferase